MNGRANMAFEPVEVCEQHDGEFARIVRDALTLLDLDKRELAREFQVAEWIISLWADGTACPGTHVQLSVLAWLARRAMNAAQVPARGSKTTIEAFAEPVWRRSGVEEPKFFWGLA
jgi:hypothetical protein